MKTVIMAGGKGTRISSLFPDIPKPLIPIEDANGISKPVLEWEIESLKKQGFNDIIITVSYMANKIQNFFGDGSRLGVNIVYYIEENPLGNAGALFKLKEMGLLEDEPFLLLNADAMFDVDFHRMLKYHNEHNAIVTLLTHPNSHPYDSGLLITDSDDSVLSWLSKEDARPKYYDNVVNSGLHIIDPKALELREIDSAIVGNEDINGNIIKVDLDRQVLKPLCGTHCMYSYQSPEYVKDIGTPERYESVSNDFKNGIVTDKNLNHQQKAIFIDRDGTINNYVGFLRNIEDFELLDGVAEAIKLINTSGYLAIVVTNQPVLARGEVSVEELNEIHKKMETLLGFEGAYIDALYYCPHHPDKGFEGEVEELKIDCECRKPKPGMLLKAARDYNIDLTSSWMIGDGKNDILAGINAGCRTALIGKGEYSQNISATSLLDAVKKLLVINGELHGRKNKEVRC